MEAIIREGALRLLTSEASCDVILSCQGHRLMAHKLILSIASPLLRILLKQDCTEPTVLIFPDINGNTMSLILDYIYTGSVVVYSNTIKDFLTAADLLQLYIDVEFLEKYKCNDDEKYKPEHLKKSNKEETDEKEKEDDSDVDDIFSRKTRRKLPSLVPIAEFPAKKSATARDRLLSNYVIPSPWCQRMMPLLSDPRTDYVGKKLHPSRDKLEENDPNNNNFQLHAFPRNLTAFATTSHILNDSNSSQLEIDLTTSFTRLAYEQRLLPHQIYKNSQKTVKDATSGRKESCGSNDVLSAALNNILDRKEGRNLEHVSGETEMEADELTRTKSSNKDEESLDEDGRCMNKQKPFKCEDCGKSFSQLRNYKYHRSVHEGTKEFAAKCSECGKVFNDRGYLSSHMKIHRDRKEYACPHCPKRFNQRVAYNMHLRIHTGVKPHECPTCGKSFSRKMLLKQHQRVHTGERPYSCPECGKTFADRSNMSLHARLHTGVKPYACNLCPKSFTKKHHLKTHMNFHTGLKPYTCQKCGLAFSQSSNMRTHYKKCILKNSANNNYNSLGPGMESADSNSGTDTR